MAGASTSLVNGALSNAAGFLVDFAPLYALPLGLATVFAIGFFIKGLYG